MSENARAGDYLRDLPTQPLPWPFLNYTDKDQKDEVTWQNLLVGRAGVASEPMLLEQKSTPPP